MEASRRAKPRTTATGTQFDAIIGVKALAIAFILGFVVGSGYSALYLADAAPSAIFGSIALVGILAFPRQILANEVGLTQRRWWGKTVSIPWGEINSIEYHRASATTVVKNRGGKAVTHCGFHRATEEFREMCTRHTRCPITAKQL